MTLIKALEYNELKCDQPDCTNNLVVFGEKKRTIRARARSQGWVTPKHGAWCAIHANGLLS